MSVEISVIIAAYNEADYIGGCLGSLQSQTHPSFEVIVVDDGSTDGTPDIAAEYGARVIYGQHKGPGLARNLGVSESQGEILCLLDADMSFHPEFLEKLVEPMKTRGVPGTFSKEEYVANWENPWARCWTMNLGLPDRKRHPLDYPDEDGVFRAIWRKDFLAVNGYDDMGYSEDYSLSRKLGKLAVMAPGAICYHHNPGSLTEVYQSARWFGRGDQVSRDVGTVLRHTLPISLKNGFIRAVRRRNPYYPVFKVVYDFGVFAGMMQRSLGLTSHVK